jgi:acetyl-CoA carboxylase biotin carboxylase subunit
MIDKHLRKEMGECSVKLASAVGYENAGTIEYLVDQHGNFYFMEMNTRIQVEHPVTEEVYGCDLVKEQILVAGGAHLSEHVVNAHPRSHAIECRINAEDPDNDFRPSPGMIDLYYAPGGRGVRVDSYVYSKYTIPPYYDSMIAKLICVGSTRSSAISRMARSLSEYLITGIKTTIPYQAKIMRHADFLRGDFDTSFIEKMTGPKPREIK